MLELLSEASLGRAICFISRNKLLKYLEERADFKFPIQYVSQLRHREKTWLHYHESSNSNGAVHELAEDDAV